MFPVFHRFCRTNQLSPRPNKICKNRRRHQKEITFIFSNSLFFFKNPNFYYLKKNCFSKAIFPFSRVTSHLFFFQYDKTSFVREKCGVCTLILFFIKHWFCGPPQKKQNFLLVPGRREIRAL